MPILGLFFNFKSNLLSSSKDIDFSLRIEART